MMIVLYFCLKRWVFFQGKQLTSFAEHALAKFQQAQESWEVRADVGVF